MSMLPVKGHRHLFRDTNSGAIINMDNRNTSDYKIAKEKILSRDKDIEVLKEDMVEIKSILKQILEK